MPDSSANRIQDLDRSSFTEMKTNRVIKAAIYVMMVAAILWLLYSMMIKKSFGNGTNSSIARPSSSAENTSIKGNGSKSFEGPGAEEKRCQLLPEQELGTRSSQAKYGMNMICSDQIPLNRFIPDFREKECMNWSYERNLPNTSVIIVFYNEGFSVLMRTVHSVIDRTPPHLLEEVLLVDDFSDDEDLKDKLETYIIKMWSGRVRLIRNKKREGLINTRSRGAGEARGTVIVFLDAHCEVGINWLPPLLAPIHNNRTTMTVPIIDGIESTNFEVRPVYQEGLHFRGIFEWGMLYKEIEIPVKEVKARAHQSEPYESPTHAGGLFAINRDYFLELGAYDPGLLIWGGENFELSFKIWQCGGRILWVPCSRVAHVYKSHLSHRFSSLDGLAINGRFSTTINYKRVVETWMDDKFKEYFYTREPIARFLDMGDISEQLKLKEKLHCKSFQWFMDNVAYDLTSHFPELPPNVHWGEMENVGTHLCLDTLGHNAPAKISVSSCSSVFSNSQLVRLNTKGQLGIGERCVDYFTDVMLEVCSLGVVGGPWRYNKGTNVVYHWLQKKCLAVDPQTKQLSLMHCDPVSPYQQWKFLEVRP